WFGVVCDGDVDIVTGLHGDERLVATLGPGAMLAEGVLLDEAAHVATARTSRGATLWTVDRAAIELVARREPAALHQLVAHVAARLTDRLWATTALVRDAADAPVV